MKKIIIAVLLYTSVNTSIKAQGIITTVAGTGIAGYSGDGGLATSAQINTPIGVIVDANNNIYFTNDNKRIRKVNGSTGNITTLAGLSTTGYSGDGGLATSAELNTPNGLVVDASGNVYISDSYNHCIRKITISTGIINTIAGTGAAGYNGDGMPATSATLNYPDGMVIDKNGNLYIADFYNHRVRKITISTGLISTIAGTGTGGYNGDGGLATSANLNNPSDVAIDTAGNIYIADVSNYRVRKIDISTGKITTIAGTGTAGFSGDGGPAISANVNVAYGVKIDKNNNAYITDRNNHRIRKIDISTGKITTIAGTGTLGFSGDGGLSTLAKLNYPHMSDIDVNGNIYISDSDNHRIRKITIPCNSLSQTISSASVTCYGLCNGILTASITGGTAPYSFKWNNGATTSLLTGLCAGLYTATVTDAAACVTVISFNINEPSALSAALTANNVSCNGAADGNISANITGGISPYNYSWSNGATVFSVTGLQPDNYTVTITDFNNCPITKTLFITQPDTLVITLNSTALCRGDDGSATVTVDGGTAPYFYNWSNGFSSSGLYGIAAGTYTVTVNDFNNCIATGSINVINGATLTAIVSNSMVSVALGMGTVLSAGGGMYYHWFPATGLGCNTCPNPFANPLVSTTEYCVEVSNVSCKDTVCITVETFKCEPFIPNAFSPNFDLQNDMECIYGSDCLSFVFKVFTRWGEEIFETTDFRQCWNGSYQGKQMDNGVFFYFYAGTYFNGEKIVKKGTISLIK